MNEKEEPTAKEDCKMIACGFWGVIYRGGPPIMEIPSTNKEDQERKQMLEKMHNLKYVMKVTPLVQAMQAIRVAEQIQDILGEKESQQYFVLPLTHHVRDLKTFPLPKNINPLKDTTDKLNQLNLFVTSQKQQETMIQNSVGLYLPYAGKTWSEFFKDETNLKDREKYKEQLRMCILKLHSCGIAHCDIHDKNVMIGDDLKVRIIDWESSFMYSNDGSSYLSQANSCWTKLCILFTFPFSNSFEDMKRKDWSDYQKFFL